MRQIKLNNIDTVLLTCLAILLIIGVVSLYSASYQKQAHTGKNFIFTQLVWILVGISVMFTVSRINYRSFLSVSYIIYVINILSLIMVLFFGKIALGAQRWINIGGFAFQPSEFTKIFVVLALARFVGDEPERLKTIKGLFWAFVITLVPMALIFKQPDLGTALIFLPILLMIVLAGGIKLKHFLAIITGALLVLPLFWHFLKDYQKNRLLVFLNPDLDPLGAGYTINQSKIAIGSGMFFGKGWFSGTQNQLNFLPERHTDFIFSVIAEEWGFLGTLLLISLFFVIIIRGLKIAETAGDISARLIAVGVTTMLAFHVIINIGMTLGLMPVVGMPLPFISYGGSALISNMIAIGFLLNIKRNRVIF